VRCGVPCRVPCESRVRARCCVCSAIYGRTAYSARSIYIYISPCLVPVRSYRQPYRTGRCRQCRSSVDTRSARESARDLHLEERHIYLHTVGVGDSQVIGRQRVSRASRLSARHVNVWSNDALLRKNGERRHTLLFLRDRALKNLPAEQRDKVLISVGCDGPQCSFRPLQRFCIR
jgi:hypothetical protein